MRDAHANRYALPDDPERSIFQFIVVAARRAWQLNTPGGTSALTSGVKPIMSSLSRPAAVAIAEAQRGMIEWERATGARGEATQGEDQP